MKNRRIILTTLFFGFLLTLLPITELDASITSLEKFRRVVVLEQGREKPLDTFAQNILKQISGRSKFQGEPAIHWLARLVFDRDVSHNDKIFLITNVDVLDSINIARQGKARERYSYSQLNPGIRKLRQLAFKASKIQPNDREFIENELIALYNKIYLYQQLMASFTFLTPGRDFSVTQPENFAALGFDTTRKDFCYLDQAEKRLQINKLAAIERGKGKGTGEEVTEAGKEITRIATQLENWKQYYSDLPFTIIPSVAKTMEGDETKKWISPWDLAFKVNRVIPPQLIHLREAVNAYKEGRQSGFDQALEQFAKSLSALPGSDIRLEAINLEVIYNKVDPFYKAMFFYGFAVIFLLVSFMAQKKWFYRFSFLLLSLGFILQIAGVCARMYIRQRPPVTNLYETFLFTGLITVLLGIILELWKKRNLGIATGGLAGLVMLMIAGKYALEGDTMGMLVAVLDSNFWLAIHVITIILGYAGIVLSGFIGHVYLVQKIVKPGNSKLLKDTFQAVYATQAFGLVFTFLGTVLGGIWADQSWGRFWGWDPKENGALLILLWALILFHARLAGWIKETGFTFGTLVGVIFVSLAWFGVNLLGVGLHSYGFTTGVAKSLFLFISFELIYITVAAFFFGKNLKKVQK
ncbi:MAG: cytochrome c biogenesis protein CcsA [bacterium]|nr:cytochrome c biogenesis protein CcsA [bacterium]